MTMNKIKYFASLDENGIVENYSTINYSHSVMEYSVDKSITNNVPTIGAKYDSNLNGFIPPKESWMDDTWTFDTETLTWCPPDPDPNVVYYFDGIPGHGKWDPETRQFYKVEL